MIPAIRMPAFLLAYALCSSGAAAQTKELSPSDLLNGTAPPIILTAPTLEWIDDGRLGMTVKPHRDSTAKYFILDAQTGREEQVEKAVLDSVRKAFAPPSVVSREGDLFLVKGISETRLTNDPEEEVNPLLSPDGRFVAFTRRNDLYGLEIESGRLVRLTTDGSDVILNGYASWLYMEEILGRASNYRAFWWSPDSRLLAFYRFDDAKVPTFPLFSFQGPRGKPITTRYPKAGDVNPSVRVGIVPPSGGDIIWGAFDDTLDQYFGPPVWRPDGEGFWVPWMNRKQNHLRIVELKPSTGSLRTVYEEKQDTWIDLDQKDRVTFVGPRSFLLKSDRTGWECLYRYALDGTLLNAVTTGKHIPGTIVHVDEEGETLFFTARNENSARTDLYRVGLDGTGLRRLTTGAFNNSVTVSPGGSYFLLRSSTVAIPPRLSLINREGELRREVFDTRNPALDEYRLPRVEHVRVATDDGLFELPVNLIMPPVVDSARRYPVLFDVYGGPGAESVMDRWILTSDRALWATEGMVIVECDHRGSTHFGKRGGESMYRNLGRREMQDYATVVRWLINRGIADSTRVGITGFSYGGYVAAYALTAGADVFTHGLAGASVTDWSLYDSHYTERWMGMPEENPEGYKNASVLAHAEKYHGTLLLVHGMLDDNVHVQNTMQLVDRLVEGGKDFELMVYPDSRHGFDRNDHAHYQKLRREFFYRHLLKKELPGEDVR